MRFAHAFGRHDVMEGEDGYMMANSEPCAALQNYPAMQAAEDILHEYKVEEQGDDVERQHAAVQIQKAWRKRMYRKYLDPEFLWTDLTTEARMQVGHFIEDFQRCIYVNRSAGGQRCRCAGQELDARSLEEGWVSGQPAPGWKQSIIAGTNTGRPQ